MIYKINPATLFNKNEIIDLVKNFYSSGDILVKGNRNEIKIFNNKPFNLNIKSFKIPILINSIIYKYFRKSKAERSYEYALKLINKNIGTPIPVAFFENLNFIGLKDSYYICEHVNFDFMFRDLIETENFPDLENILRQFTRFSFDLHEKGIEFLDHSPGNTLIKKTTDRNYQFFLVDLNRMKFHQSMSLETRIKNLCRLTPSKEMVAIISNEYAKISGEPEQLIFDTLWKMTAHFQDKFNRKKRLKKKLKFWQ